jgi:hypothetical protein
MSALPPIWLWSGQVKRPDGRLKLAKPNHTLAYPYLAVPTHAFWDTPNDFQWFWCPAFVHRNSSPFLFLLFKVCPPTLPSPSRFPLGTSDSVFEEIQENLLMILALRIFFSWRYAIQKNFQRAKIEKQRSCGDFWSTFSCRFGLWFHGKAV